MPLEIAKPVRRKPLVVNPDDWEPLGAGAYNEVYRSKRPLRLDPLSPYVGLWVLKFPKLDYYPFAYFDDVAFQQLQTFVASLESTTHADVLKESQLLAFVLTMSLADEKYDDQHFRWDEVECLMRLLEEFGQNELRQKLNLKSFYDPFTGADRELRILKEIYGGRERIPQAKILRSPDQDPSHDSSYAWAVPYLNGRQATDDEMAVELVNIYRKTRRIVTDAPAKENFLTITTEDGCEETYCIDYDYALKRTSSRLSIEAGGKVGSDSIYDLFWDFWSESSDKYPHTVSTIISLLVLEERLDPSHDLDPMLTPYVVGGLRYFRKLPKDKLIPFNQVLLENLSFLEKRAVVLDCHWYEAVYRFSKSAVIFTESSYHNLLNTPAQIGDTVSGRNDWLDALVILSEQDIWLTARDLRRVSIEHSRSGDFKQALSILLEYYQVSSFAEPEVTDMDTSEDSLDVAADSSRVDAYKLGRHPQTFFGCKAEVGRGDDSYQSEVPQQHHRGHGILDWVVSTFSLRGLLY